MPRVVQALQRKLFSFTALWLVAVRCRMVIKFAARSNETLAFGGWYWKGEPSNNFWLRVRRGFWGELFVLPWIVVYFAFLGTMPI